jgi:hypothetical protein
MIRHCCEMMNSQASHVCNQHPNPFDCPDAIILFSAAKNQYGLIIHDGGTSSVTIEYCPWCGKKIPLPFKDVEASNGA